MIDITATDLNELGTVALRKLARELGLKGMSSARGADLRIAIEPIKAQQIEAAKPRGMKKVPLHPATPGSYELVIDTPAKPETPKKGVCEDCGRKVGKSGHPTLCEPCYDYAGWENTHSDDAHGTDGFTGVPSDKDVCPVCHPELDRRTERKTGKSRAGMVILAKGDEVHKSSLFKAMAEAKGWTVQVTVTLNASVDEDEDAQELHTAIASRGLDTIVLKWNGRAYDYANSGATLNGKPRKVRNLKEATRLI